MEINCPNCGRRNDFPAWQIRKGRRFCDPACYRQWSVGQKRGHYKGHEPEEKPCIVCGTLFVVGGRGNPPRKTRFCSTTCRDAGRYRRGAKARLMADTEAAYLAGVLDGEGSVILYMRRDVVALRVTVANTYRPLLERVQQLTDVGDLYHQRDATAKHKAAYSWRCNAEAAESLLVQVRPYLVVKAAQADLALETQARLRDPAAKADRSWHLGACEQMRALNRRGPA